MSTFNKKACLFDNKRPGAGMSPFLGSHTPVGTCGSPSAHYEHNLGETLS